MGENCEMKSVHQQKFLPKQSPPIYTALPDEPLVIITCYNRVRLIKLAWSYLNGYYAMYGIFTIIYTVCLLLIFNVKIEWNSRGHILFDIHGIPTENAILTTYQLNAKEMSVNLDAEKNIR